MRPLSQSFVLTLSVSALSVSLFTACGDGAAASGGQGGTGGASNTASTSSSAATGGGTSTSTTSSSASTGSTGGAGTGGGVPCGIYEGKNFFNCSPDGHGRGKCIDGSLTFETCDRGCLIKPVGEDDVCMGTTNTWSCEGSYGTSKIEDGDYYATEFGCWVDKDGDVHTDPGDNCIPACLSKAQSDGLCAGMDGPTCEQTVNWYAADGARFGCLARLRVENPANGKAVIVVALDYGPGCKVEKSVSHAILDLSGAANEYLFGGPQGAVDMTLVHVVEVSKSTPLGPVN